MVAGISTIASLSPIIASQMIFSSRRLSKGIDALENNPLNAVMNFDIATAQCIKGSSAALEAAKGANPAFSNTVSNINRTAKNIANSSKIAKGLSAVIDFTARNINPVICGTSAFKAITAEKGEKLETAADESVRLTSMFAFEGAYKSLAGMPRYERINGKLVSKPVESILYRDVKVVRDVVDKFVKFCDNTVLFKNKSFKLPLKFLPGTLKGLGFVVASIAGYNLGSAITKKVGINQDYSVQGQETQQVTE